MVAHDLDLVSFRPLSLKDEAHYRLPVSVPAASDSNLGTYATSFRGGAMKLKVVLESSDEGGYTIYVPSLPGCVSEGDSVEEAMVNIREAIEFYLEIVGDDILNGEGLEVLELVV